jgi:hypothetical protein
MRYRSVSATEDERTRRLAGDELIPNTIGQLTHAITIHRPPHDVWPWLVQMGAGSRAGWYSYDRFDNGGHPSANRVLPYLQQIRVGTLFPALPSRFDGFHVLAVKQGTSLVLGWRTPGGNTIMTWAFVLEEAHNTTTRLVARARASLDYPFFGLPRVIGGPLVRAVHFVMQRKQLLGIARRAEQFDVLLDALIPDYDIVERHRVRVNAPPSETLAAAEHVDLRDSLLIRAILRLRGLAMGAKRTEPARPHGLVAETTSMGWRVLAETPGQEIVLGAATQPWLADVTFRPLAPERFAGFDEPGYVKIVWTLRVDPAFPDGTIFQTETRALATDADARDRFRRYWTRVVPGVVAIRWILLRLLKKAAEANQLQSLAHGGTH